MKFRLSKNHFFILLCCLLFSCSTNKIIDNIENPYIKKVKFSEQEWKNWQHKDIQDDSIAGVSIDKAYAEIIKNKQAKEVVVAIIDTRLDINHEEIRELIWVNNDEIPNNGIDDDHNGYVDDIHGWNYLGNSRGEQLYLSSLEVTRILKQKIVNPEKQNSLFNKAKNKYEKELQVIKHNINYLDSLKLERKILEDELSKVLSIEKISLEKLKSYSSNDSIIKFKINKLIKHLEDVEWIEEREERENLWLNIYLGLDYNDRKIIGDNPYDINDVGYGNHNIASDNSKYFHRHSIKVAGVISAERSNNKGIKGVTNKIRLMPICVSPFGDEHDKDIALGVRYAVDNGAKVINMSFVKYFAQNNVWINDAIKYAAKKDVLIVRASGNESSDLDSMDSFPNDYDFNNDEFSNNFLVVGANRAVAKENFVAEFSNYGKNNVDIFAPGKFIYTTFSSNNYKYDSGTSLAAPIVSGIAALIRSFYPKLTAAEVKQIIMESGVSLDIMVNKPSTSKEKELVPFSSLSKSGKIVNAYNALLMAEEVSKKKKK